MSCELRVASGEWRVTSWQVLELLTFDSGSVGRCLLNLWIIIASTHAAAYLCLVSSTAQRFATLAPPSTARVARHGGPDAEGSGGTVSTTATDEP